MSILIGKNTKVSNVWIEHTNVGAWVGRDYSDTPAYWNPADGLEFSGMRIRDTFADGINFANGSRNSKVYNSSFRTTGDDSLAVWSSTFVKDQSVDIGHDNHFTNNTIQLPWRANGIAVYGGYGNTIENNLIGTDGAGVRGVHWRRIGATKRHVDDVAATGTVDHFRVVGQHLLHRFQPQALARDIRRGLVFLEDLVEAGGVALGAGDALSLVA